MTRTRKNLDAVDIVKYIMSILIVATHTSLFNGHITPLVRLAVPVFFVFSGYFFFSKLEESDSKEGDLLTVKNTVKRNLQLYGFWFILLLPLTLYVRKYISLGFLKGGLQFLQDFFFASTFQSSWYIMALILGVLIVFLLSFRFSNPDLIGIGIIFYIPCLLSSNYNFIAESTETFSSIYHGFVSVFSLPCRNFFVSILYLAIGKMLAENPRHGKKNKDFAYFIVFFALMVCEYFTLKLSGFNISGTDCYIMLPLTVFYFCRWVISLEVRCSFARTLRNISTLSYCCHMAVFMVVGKLFKIFGIPDYQNLLLFAVTLILTQTASLVIIKLSQLKKLRILRYSY